MDLAIELVHCNIARFLAADVGSNADGFPAACIDLNTRWLHDQIPAVAVADNTRNSLAKVLVEVYYSLRRTSSTMTYDRPSIWAIQVCDSCFFARIWLAFQIASFHGKPCIARQIKRAKGLYLEERQG